MTKGTEVVPDAAPISIWRVPLAALSEQEGGGSPALTFTVLPPGPLSVPETQVLLHPVAPSTQKDSRSRVEAVRERWEWPCRSIRENPGEIMVRRRRPVKLQFAAGTREAPKACKQGREMR